MKHILIKVWTYLLLISNIHQSRLIFKRPIILMVGISIIPRHFSLSLSIESIVSVQFFDLLIFIDVILWTFHHFLFCFRPDTLSFHRIFNFNERSICILLDDSMIIQLTAELSVILFFCNDLFCLFNLWKELFIFCKLSRDFSLFHFFSLSFIFDLLLWSPPFCILFQEMSTDSLGY